MNLNYAVGGVLVLCDFVNFGKIGYRVLNRLCKGRVGIERFLHQIGSMFSVVGTVVVVVGRFEGDAFENVGFCLCFYAGY